MDFRTDGKVYPTSRDPYRSEIEDPEPEIRRSEIPYCGWCKHHYSLDISPWDECGASARRSPVGEIYETPIAVLNDRGQCENWEPSIMTRIARMFRRRAPDYTGKLFQIKPKNSSWDFEI